LIKQFLSDVDWNDLDYLIIDTPPGTSDEHLAIVSYLSKSNLLGSILVTTPQEVALLDVRKELNFCVKTNTPILGVIENMSGFVCPSCKLCSEIFKASTGGAEKMCKEFNVPLLGKLPIDPNISIFTDKGKSILVEDEKLDKLEENSSPTVKELLKIVDFILNLQKN